ncbi:hypothetical protein ONE63_000586 [Megalurothrips usitatus]|uniref:Uncharacterized protein n=1 Tax=Megalurothrips usitatus TaxID=439358 RepID=A0AAV7Y2E3_9NEOP|nr:hypothetical protein ONE63_000586 [Megalurothrips usitatus]
MLAACAVAASLAVLIAFCLRATLTRLLYGREEFLERVILVLHALYETMPLSVPALHWPAAASLAQYFNDWTALQLSWQSVTGEPLRLTHKPSRAWAAGGTLVYAVASPFYHVRVSPHLFAWKVPVYSFCVCLAIAQGALWRALNREVVATARGLRALFRQRRVAGALTGDAVRGQCMLWLRLRRQAQALGDTWGGVMLHSLLLMAMMSMTSCFGLLSALQRRMWRRVVSTAATITIATSIIDWICSEGDHAVRSVRHGGRAEGSRACAQDDVKLARSF